MEISPVRGLFELGIDESSFIHQWHLDSIEDELLPMSSCFGGQLQHTLSHSNFSIKPPPETPDCTGLPVKHFKPNSWNSSSNCISLVNSSYLNQTKPKDEEVPYDDQNYVFKAGQGGKRISSTTNRLSQTQDHIIAERKRREKLSQRFIALSAIIPGLKKMDKASVLGDAIKYLKQLQERVKILEEQTRKKTMESVVYVKKSQLLADNDNSNSNESFSSELLPEIEARVCDKNILIRIHCEKRKGILEKTVAELEKLHLIVVNTSAMTFGGSALDITIIAQMDVEFSMTVMDLVKKLRSAVKLFM